jgi:hypothetical protein
MMNSRWVLAMTAGAVLAVGMPGDAFAQGRSAEARQRQEQRGQDERERERDRLRQQRESEARIAAERRQREEREARAREQRQTIARLNEAEARRREAERDRLRDQRGRYDDRYDRRDDRWDDDRRWDNGRDNKGPAFCRSGAGHPVFGRDWCRQKGFDLGRDRWERTRWDDVVFRNSRRNESRLGRSVLADILGVSMLNRFESYGRQHSRDPLVGYWMPERRSNVLMLAVGDLPIARLIDPNRDGRVDQVFLWR